MNFLQRKYTSQHNNTLTYRETRQLRKLTFPTRLATSCGLALFNVTLACTVSFAKYLSKATLLARTKDV